MSDKKWSVKTPIEVRWGDMDAMGHVNNTIYFRYFESARIDYFRKLGLMDKWDEDGIGPILAHTSCQFILPVSYPDNLVIYTRVKKLGNTSMIHEYEVHSEKLGLAAKGDSVVVYFDYKNNKKVPFSNQFKQAIENLQNIEL